MPDASGRDRLKPGTSAPKPKKPKGYKPPKNPDTDMADYDFNTPKKSTPKKKKKKSKSRRALLQVDRTFTPKEWQTIARSMDDRRRPYVPRPVGRGRVGGWRRNLNPRRFRR